MLIIGFFSFWLGACIGSFLNVVVWRVPRGESIVRPPSHCPKCNASIKWHQNIPILSWLALRGRCANCREPISPRYILVELLTGLLFLAAFWKCSPVYASVGPDGVASFTRIIGLPVVWWVWISLMVVGSFIDFDHQLLPDFVTVGGMILGVVYACIESALLFVGVGATMEALRPLMTSLVGLAFGFGLMWLIRYVGTKAFKREAMGLGDVFLMGAIGALFGPVSVMVTLVVSAVAGSIVGVTLILLSKTKLGSFMEIPYGPYICMGCLSWMFFGPELVRWYLDLVGF